MTNQDAITSALMDSLHQVGWVPGLPTIISALSIDAEQVARDLARSGALMTDGLTDVQLSGLLEAKGPRELRTALLQLARR